ncbi:hypothetical protein [Glaciibacter sp. 2TAF33]|uniref:hypothetical protein n=1 Tax=Glaciibacter sp. 2TAF33 TaxID=3233015 RepID=UPI003F930792
MDVLAWVLITLALICVASVVIVAVVLRMVYTRLRRSRPLNSAVLRARTRLSWGPRHEVLKLRMRLNDTLVSGQLAVELAGRTEPPRGELPRLFHRIQSEGVTLESQLRLMATETDPVMLAEGIPAAKRRVEQVAGLVRRLRSVVADGLGEVSDDALARLRFDVDREVTALNAGLQELHALNQNDALFDPRRQPAMDRLTRGNKS